MKAQTCTRRQGKTEWPRIKRRFRGSKGGGSNAERHTEIGAKGRCGRTAAIRLPDYPVLSRCSRAGGIGTVAWRHVEEVVTHPMVNIGIM
jgi:hypothetical protein